MIELAVLVIGFIALCSVYLGLIFAHGQRERERAHEREEGVINE